MTTAHDDRAQAPGQADNNIINAAASSDYGSDIDDATADALLANLESPPLSGIQLEDIVERQPGDEACELRVGARASRLGWSPIDSRRSRESVATPSIEVEYDESNRRAFSPATSPTPDDRDGSSVQTTTATRTTTREDRGIGQNLSPLQRFRTPPKKPLSVTDLVSPAWCEQQYEYSLTKYGRVRKTPAMRQGSNVHRELEEQVHTQVPVTVVSAEDRFGLRIWNTIQGLRTLRETGLTRELEVWGVIEGQVVIGIIDEVTTVCPDEAMATQALSEAQQAREGGKRGQRRKKEDDELPSNQPTLEAFMTSGLGGSKLESNPELLASLSQHAHIPAEDLPRTYYIVDIKTRQSRSLPAAGAPSRATYMQLMIYHRLLSALAANQVPSEQIFSRYSLDPNARFSDHFIAELANLDIHSLLSSTSDGNVPAGGNASTSSPQSDPLSELLEHNTLTDLWSLLIEEAAVTFSSKGSSLSDTVQSPAKSTSTTSSNHCISPILTAEFRTASASTNHDSPAGALLGRRCFTLNAALIDDYIADEMRWWRGERPTQGVEVEEAFKCRLCEFADACTWRATKVEEGVRKARLRAEKRNKSTI